MKLFRRLALSILFGIQSIFCYSQTTIGGMIDSNIQLKKINSPFLVQTDLVISPNGKITIEPGVTVRFANGVKLEVRGTLIVNGTETDSITFTSHSAMTKGSWAGVYIINTQGGNATFRYAKFSYASSAIQEECCWGGLVSVKRTSFIANATAIGGYSGNVTPVDSCYFYGNTAAINQADKDVDHSIFDNNNYGLMGTERVNVANSTFTNHSEAALSGGRGTVKNCVIENNSTGIRSSFQGFTVSNSIVSNNEIGIELVTEGHVEPVSNNRICNNTSYNIKNSSSYSADLYNNCWCTTDSTTVENKIYDGLDDATKGMLSYDILDDDCDAVTLHVNKLAPQLITWTLDNSPYVVSNDYVIQPNKTLVIEPGVEVRFADGAALQVRGTLIAEGTRTDSITFTSHTGTAKASWDGVYIMNTQGGNATFRYTEFSYASSAIQEECCWGGKVAVKHATFIANATAIGGYSGNVTPVDSCYFTGNTAAITQADKDVDHSIFDNNDYGLMGTERVNVANSTFTNHSEAALWGGRGTVTNCVIENNSTGIRSQFEGYTVTSSIVSNNEIGIELATSGPAEPMTNNKICNNTSYNIKSSSSYSADLYNNCWCTTDSTTVENKIFDGLDDVTKGMLSYDVLDDDCDAVTLHVNKLEPQLITWTLDGSPYVVSNDYVILPNKTLLIEPGVKVRFAVGAALQVRGTLIAEGTRTDSIIFTSHTGTIKASWDGVYIMNTQGGNATFRYTEFTYASSAIQEECCWGGKVAVKHATFIANTTAIGGYSGNVTPVDSCYFSGNTAAITQADKNVDHSIFDNNDYGLMGTERVNVSNSTFTNHSEVALSGGRGTVTNCIIEYNSTAIRSSYEGFRLTDNVISYNDVGIDLHISGPSAVIKDNQICHNGTYNILNSSNYPAELYDNCWCTGDSTTVENKIFDGWDDTSKGLVDYTLYSDDCNTPILVTMKAQNRVVYFVTGAQREQSEIKLYPNPVVRNLSIENVHSLREVSIYASSGQFLERHSFNNESRADIDVSQLKSGVYLLFINQGGVITTRRLVKIE
jgi:hypothetical protein